MRILFLDIDGVLVTPRSQFAQGRPDALDREACSLIQQICEQADARIVVSSTWREGESRESFAQAVGALGLHTDRLHQDWATPVLASDRQAEIDAWLSDHADVTEWAILDDGIGLDESSPRLVRTDFDNGIGFEQMLSLCTVLGLDAAGWCARAGVKFTASDRQRVALLQERLDSAP